jgi:hypothetical protein
VTTLPLLHVHGASEPVSKPPLTSPLPPPPVGEVEGEADGEAEGDREGEADGEAERDGEGEADAERDGDGPPVGVVHDDALPLTAFTTELNSVADGSRSYRENIIAPAYPLQWM